MNWIIENWMDVIAIVTGLIAVAEVIVRLTPTEKDNSILLKIKNILNAVIPNKSKNGGNFK